MQIVWTRLAKVTYFEILENLKKHWTAKEIRVFHRLTEENLTHIISGKTLHPIIDSNSEIRRIVVHPNVALFYKIHHSKNELILITFFNNRMDPKILKKLLKTNL